MTLRRSLCITAACTSLWLLSSPALACGWNDYELEIGDGYEIVRANSLDVYIARDGIAVLFPSDYSEVGPVVAYQMQDRYLFTRNAGRKPRNAFANDSFELIDTSAVWYFVIPKDTGRPLGPFTREAFEQALAERGLTEVKWKTPRNPTFVVPLVLTAAAVLVSFPAFAVLRRLNGWIWKQAGYTPTDSPGDSCGASYDVAHSDAWHRHGP